MFLQPRRVKPSVTVVGVMDMTRSPPCSRKLTLDDAIAIWRRRGRGEAQHVLAADFGVNQGRIAEVLSGKRFPEAKRLAESEANC
jgi:hypothetical protein